MMSERVILYILCNETMPLVRIINKDRKDARAAAVVKLRPFRQQHPFHMVNPSPWPFLVSVAVLSLIFSLITLFNRSRGGSLGFDFAILALLSIIAA